MSYPPSLPPAPAPYRPTNGQPTHVVRHASQTQRHHPYRDSPGGRNDPPDAPHDPAYDRYDERAPPPGTYDQYNGGSPGYSAAPLPGRAPHVPPPPPLDYPPSAGASPHTPQTHPVHPGPPAPPPPHPGYHEVPAQAGYHPPPGSLYSASTYGNLNGQGLDPADLPNDLSALADAHPGQKPPYPYSTIIRYAIQGSPRQRLTLSELYETMEARFPWFKTAGNGWKVHNTSFLLLLVSLTTIVELGTAQPIAQQMFRKGSASNYRTGQGVILDREPQRPRRDASCSETAIEKAKAEAENSQDNTSQGPSVTDTASPGGGSTPSPPPQLPGANGSPGLPPPPGANGYPPNWAETDSRWAQQHSNSKRTGCRIPHLGRLESRTRPQPIQHCLVTKARQARGASATGSWPHQPANAQPPSWPRPRNDAPAPPANQAYAPPLPPPNAQQRPQSAASNGSG
ncbi:Forkhead domain [Ceratobasidium sp. AG-Ba]|nr:Forkhead domain [Ceratobasidium sp. AG-Ba]